MNRPIKKRKTDNHGGLGATFLEERVKVSDEGIIAKTPTMRHHESDGHPSSAASRMYTTNTAHADQVIEPPVTHPRQQKDGIPQMSKRDIKWNEMFHRLIRYKAKHRDCLVPQNYEEDMRLGRWVHYQRAEYWILQHGGRGKISQARIDKLENIGFEWDPQLAKWNCMFRRLVDFHSVTGHCMVPKNYKEDPELGNWVRNQRFEYSNLKKSKKSRMSEERIKALNSMGFQWKPSTTARR